MQTLTTTALLSLLTLVMAVMSAPAPAAMPESLLIESSWEAFADQPALGSLAWAGEDETLLHSHVGGMVVTNADSELDPRLLTGLAAPEPPALVLAGMAFGGVICGRSLLARRRRRAGDGQSASDES